jgi:CheY-like chemotaxis protein
MAASFLILLVEDNADDEHLTLRSLRKLGSEVSLEVARDGQEALDRILDCAKPDINLILLDLHLPKVNGIEVLHGVRGCEATAHIPVVVLTSSEEPEDIRSSYQQHANSYIKKPVSVEDFSEVVQRLGIYWREMNVKPA